MQHTLNPVAATQPVLKCKKYFLSVIGPIVDFTKPPRKRGLTLKNGGSGKRQGLYMLQQRWRFSAGCNCCCLLKFRIRPHLGIMKKLRWRPQVLFSVRSVWLTNWHRKFPLIFDHLNLSDFEKWGLFGKLILWGVRRYKHLGPHPIRIQNFPPFFPQKAYNRLFVGEKAGNFRILMGCGPKFL